MAPSFGRVYTTSLNWMLGHCCQVILSCHSNITNASCLLRKGDVDKFGKQRKTSSFNLLVSGNLDPNTNVEEVANFIDEKSEAFVYLQTKNIGNTIDFGCVVGTRDNFMRSISLSQKLLLLLGKYSIILEFSAYPGDKDET